MRFDLVSSAFLLDIIIIIIEIPSEYENGNAAKYEGTERFERGACFQQFVSDRKAMRVIALLLKGSLD